MQPWESQFALADAIHSSARAWALLCSSTKVRAPEREEPFRSGDVRSGRCDTNSLYARNGEYSPEHFEAVAVIHFGLGTKSLWLLSPVGCLKSDLERSSASGVQLAELGRTQPSDAVTLALSLPPTAALAALFLRHVAGGSPNSRLNARLNEASDS